MATRKVMSVEVQDKRGWRTWWYATLSCGHSKVVGGGYDSSVKGPPKRVKCEKCEARKRRTL